MNRKAFYLILPLLLAGALAAFPLELGATFRLENMSFDRERSVTDDAFSGMDLHWGGSLYGVQPISGSLFLETGLVSDTILRNYSYTLLSYREHFVTLSMGPLFGLFNSADTILKSGISTTLRLLYPGIGFLQLRSDSTLGGRLVEAGDYVQELSEASLGYYIPNAICSVSLLQKKFTQKKANAEVVDAMMDYAFHVDIFQKNVPYKVQLSFAYQTLYRRFIEPAKVTDHTLGSIILGTRVDWSIGDSLSLLFDLQSSIYTFGQDELLGISNPGPGGYLFRLVTGVQLDFARLPGRSLP
jgi:hypothetical protein